LSGYRIKEEKQKEAEAQQKRVDVLTVKQPVELYLTEYIEDRRVTG